MVEILAARTGAAIEIARLYRREAESRGWLQAVLDQMPEAMVLTDTQGRVTLENRVAKTLTGSDGTRSGAGPRVSLDLRSPSGEPVPSHELPHNVALERRETTHGRELSAVCADGRRLPVLVSAAPVWSDTGEIQGCVMLVQDVSSMKQIERMREEWSALVAHDLQQPINAITLRCDLLLRDRSLTDKQRSDVQNARTSAKRMSRMVTDLMDASLLETNRMRLKLRRVDLGEFTREAVGRAPDPSERIRLSAAAPHLVVQADAGRLEQVVSNLLSNAFKYGSPEGEISVSLRQVGAIAELSISNPGPGIPDDELSTLFDRYTRARAARISTTDGAGLGLYIARGLIEAHGGTLSASSEMGVSTTFRIQLPLLSSNHDPTTAPV